MKVTYEEMKEAKEVFLKAQEEFNNKYQDYLDTVLEEAGIKDKIVTIMLDGNPTKGKIKVVKLDFSNYPYDVRFFPFTKSGTISQKQRYVPHVNTWRERDMLQQLKDIILEVHNASEEEIAVAGEKCR